MMTESVNIDFNVGGNFSSSLSQMIAQADAYTNAAGGVLGKITALNGATVSLLQRTNALTGANKAAVAQAAAYQQALSGIEASAKIAGTSIDGVKAAALDLARASGSLSEAVQTIQALQTSGVTAEESISKLGKAFQELGHANGLNGAAIGKELLGLNRIFGNSMDQVSKFGDSLTTLSKRYGASADGTLGFAKALAPIASAAGMSETAVLGLGAAAARLGEDGYASATAFNKVVIDMSSAMRDGGPQLMKYSQLLNMSQKNLADMWKADPSEVVIRFTEAIKKGGPEAQRSLEALGLDSVRTIRSIQALSSQGNLRQIIDESTNAYGDGSTAKAAETAMGGVNAQAAKLGETLSQTVSAAGTPFLTFLGKVMSLANGVADAIRGIVASPFGQFLGTATTVMSGVGSIGFQALTALSTLALIRRVGGFGLRKGDEFSQAARAARSGETVGGSAVSRAGGWYGRLTPDGAKVGDAARMTPYSTARAAFRGTGVASAGALGWAGRMVGKDYQTSDNNGQGARSGNFMTAPFRRWLYDEKNAQARAAASTSVWQPTTPTQPAPPTGQPVVQPMPSGPRLTGPPATPVLPAPGVLPTGPALPMPAPTGPMLPAPVPTGQPLAGPAIPGKPNPFISAAKGGLAVGAESAMFAGRMAGAAGRAVLSTAAGMAPMAAVMGAVMGGIALKGVYDNQKERQKAATEDIVKDVFKPLNEFAAAAGLASKGLVNFTEVVQKTTRQLVNENKSLSDASAFTGEEISNATSPGYKRAFEPQTDNAEILASQGRLMLGPNASPAEIKRFEMDVLNKYGLTKALEVQSRMNVTQGQSLTDSILAAQKGLSDATWFGGRTDALDTTQADVTSATGAYVARTVDTYGSGASSAADISSIAQLYEAASKTKNSVARGHLIEVLASRMGIKSEDFLNNALTKGLSLSEMVSRANELRTGGPKGVAAPDNYAWFDTYNAVMAANPDFDPLNPDKTYSKLATTPEMAKQAAERERSGWEMGYFAGPVGRQNLGASSMYDVLYGYNDYKMGRISRLPAGAQAMQDFRDDPSSLEKLTAAAEALNSAARYMSTGAKSGTTSREQGGSGIMNYGIATYYNSGILTTVSPGEPGYRAAMVNQSKQNAAAALSVEGVGVVERGRKGLATLNLIAGAGPAANQEQADANQQIWNAAAQDVNAELAAQKQFVLAKRQYDLQIQYMDRDNFRARKRAREEYHIQMHNAEEDFNIQQQRATNAFFLARKDAENDHEKQLNRAHRDYDRQVLRANEDFNTQRLRSERDFGRQMRRMVEDQAKTIYDPYKRIQAQQVWDAKSLLSNLKEQNTAILRQASELDRARAMGLSQAAISQLQLANPQNAQQLSRLLQDAMNDPSIIRQLNLVASQRGSATEGLTSQSDSYIRAQEDFSTAMSDTEADFRRSLARSAQDFNTSLHDLNADFRQGMFRSRRDFKIAQAQSQEDYDRMILRAWRQYKRGLKLMDQELTTTKNRALDQLLEFGYDITTGPQGIATAYVSAVESIMGSVSRMPAKFRKPLSDNILAMYQDAKGPLALMLDKLLGPYGLDHSALFAAPPTSPARPPGRPGPASGSAGGGTGGDASSGNDSSSPPVVPPGAPGAGHGRTPPPRNNGGGSSSPPSGGGPHYGTGSAAGGPVRGRGTSTSDSIPMMLSNGEWVISALGSSLAPEGLLEALNRGDLMAASKILSDRMPTATHAGNPYLFKPAIDPTKTGSGSDRAQELLDADRKIQEADAKAIAKKAAEAQKAHESHLRAMLAKKHRAHEAHRAHEIHAARSARSGQHVNGQEVRASQTAQYASPVTNNTYNYDQRTQFTGPISVQADDPQKMLSELKKKIAHSRLVSPGRAAQPTSV